MLLLLTALSLSLLQGSFGQLIEGCTDAVLGDMKTCGSQALDKVMPTKEQAGKLLKDLLDCMEPSGCTLLDVMKTDAAAFEAQKQCAKDTVKEVIVPKLGGCLTAQRPELADLPTPDTDKMMDFAFLLRSAKFHNRIQKQLLESCGSEDGVQGLVDCILDKSDIKDMVSELLEDSQHDFIKTKIKVFTELGQCYTTAPPPCIKVLVELGGLMCGCVESDLMADGKPIPEVADAFAKCELKAEESAILGGIRKLCSFHKPPGV